MNFTKSHKFLTVLTAVFAIGAYQATASAGFIQGGIGFGGLFTPTGGTGADLSDATGIDIDFSVVTTASGDFVPAIGQTALFNHVDFDPANTPVTPFWAVNASGIDYTFDLLDISLGFRDADEINLSGAGIIMATGFDNTPGEWTFTGNQGNVFFTFSSISTAIAEPSTLLLLGIGFIGLGLMRKRVS